MKTACLSGSREARARVSITELLYFDHNAATPLAPEVAETFAAAMRDIFGNEIGRAHV